MASSTTNKLAFHAYENMGFPDQANPRSQSNLPLGLTTSATNSSNLATTTTTNNNNINNNNISNSTNSLSLADIAINKAAIDSPFPDPLHGKLALFILPLLLPLSSRQW